MEKIVCVLVVVLAAIQAVPVEKQIVSGEDAVECEFPHMVFIDVILKDRTSYCGATLISKKFVLTAAHCLEGDVVSVTAHMGSTTKAHPETAIPVKRWVLHNGYHIDGAVFNDVALMELSKPVEFSRCIQPIALPKKGEVFTGTCVAAGWGYTGDGGHYPTQMKRAEVDTIPLKACQKRAYGITNQHVCIGDQTRNGNNICFGDSGGGLVCQDKTGKPVVAGVASYVFDCNEGFGVFASTEYYLGFIKGLMRAWQ